MLSIVALLRVWRHSVRHYSDRAKTLTPQSVVSADHVCVPRGMYRLAPVGPIKPLFFNVKRQSSGLDCRTC